MSPDATTCPACGARLPPGTPPAACPRCLLRRGLESSAGDVVITGRVRHARPPPPSPEEIARDFPQLEILEVLGQGGMGVVYKARQRGLDRLVALKILSVDATDEASADFAERFAREARALASLQHPGIVAVHDSGRAGERFYLLMEYVDGTDLRRMLRAQRIAPREALAIVSQVCDALQYAHDAGLVHRDIKPENILVDRQGRARIADFGLAKLLGRPGDERALTGPLQAMGTLHYMAPEQIERPLEVDHRADIYSLGVVLYELLTGELPIGRFPPPSQRIELDVRLDEVVLKTLEKDPPRRYQHASEVKTRLDDISHGGGTGAVRGVPPERDRERKLRVGMLVLGLGCLAWGLFSALRTGHVAHVLVDRASLLLVGPWLLLGCAGLAIALVSWLRRERARGRPLWPWALGAGALGLAALPFGCAGLLLLGRSRQAEHAQTAAAEVLPADSSPSIETLPLPLHRTIDLLRAEGRLSSSEDLGRLLAELARMPDLGDSTKLQLIQWIAAGRLDPEEQADVLVALITVQDLELPARLQIRDIRDRMPNGPTRERISEALAARWER